MTDTQNQQYVILNKNTWDIIEKLLMELPFKISFPVVNAIQNDSSKIILSSSEYEKIISLLKSNENKN
ncbi:MAG: hypothetical protein NZZ41_04790 [Candidatus Dojkabacteria bacterium]|nr:hypothetical protein [Candidatus Dojkabacteria bacterium]